LYVTIQNYTDDAISYRTTSQTVILIIKTDILN